jgi:hypothetical protein
MNNIPAFIVAKTLHTQGGIGTLGLSTLGFSGKFEVLNLNEKHGIYSKQWEQFWIRFLQATHGGYMFGLSKLYG